MKLENIVPWGRTLEEYISMFNLTKNELHSKILGCGDGPASFNAELTVMGGNVVSVDPTYAFSQEELLERINEVADEVMPQIYKNKDAFVWKNIKNPEHLYEVRMGAMKIFLEDYDRDTLNHRYKNEMLPNLSFSDAQFDLALSSHFLFLYSEHLDEKFHMQAILEMLRIAREVRIFPIVTLEGKKSPHLDTIIKKLKIFHYQAEIVATDYEFQKGGNEMLKIVKIGKSMKNKKAINITSLFEKVLGDKIKDFTLPPPIFEVMKCEIIEYDAVQKSLITKMPVLKEWLNPYGTMQGGMIDAAIDNAVGPLSMLVAPANMTRTIETKLLKAIVMDVGYIYVQAHLAEEKKRRLTFEVSVVDDEDTVYATSKVVNFIL